MSGRGAGWSGQFHAGDGWAVYRGAAGDNRLHAHPAMQLVFAPGSATLRGPDGGEVSGPALFAGPGTRHALLPIADVLLVFLEPQSPAAARVDRVVPRGEIAILPPGLAGLVDLGAPVSEAAARLVAAPDRPPVRDARLAAALAFLAQAEGARAIARAAVEVGLSPVRLRALAQAELGTPLGAWLAWRRLRRASAAMAEGASLADAAAAAGFADQAHLSRDMRKVFGITPAAAQHVMGPAQADRSRP